MDKLNKLAMPDVKSGTPQEKMNAVKKALQSLEMLTEAYNQIVPVINAKIDWLSEAEKVTKDDTQDKKIDELIAVNKMLLGRINSMESKSDELSRAQNGLDKAIKSIETPKIPSVEPLRKRIKALEDKPQYVYDDKEIKSRLLALEARPQVVPTEKYDDSKIAERLSAIDKMIKSLDKRVDFVRRNHSEMWEKAESDRVKFQTEVRSIADEINSKEIPDISPIASKVEEISKEIKRIEIPAPQDLDPIVSRIKALEDKPSVKPTLVDNSECEHKMSEVEKSVKSLDKRLDFIKRTYSEKWSSIQFDKASDDKLINGKLDAIESEIESIKNSVCNVTK